MKLNRIILSIFLGSLIAVNAFTQECPGPKFGIGHDGEKNICNRLKAANDTDFLIITISLTFIYGKENDPQYRADLKTWSDSLFTNYDLRYWANPQIRLIPPNDSNVSWAYNGILATKKTILEMVKESYVMGIDTYTIPETGIAEGIPGKSNPGIKTKIYYDLSGRQMNGTRKTSSFKPEVSR
jgi:hypothetical protein